MAEVVASFLNKFFGKTVSEGTAFAFGLATGPVLAPEVEDLKNLQWRTHPSKALDANSAAEIVAEDVDSRDWGANEAASHGIDGTRFDALVGAVLNAPGVGELMQARRRKLISQATFEHGLRKARLETLWDAPMEGLLDVLLTVADLANAVVQGHMTQDAAAAEAELQGVSAARFDVLVQNTGLPPGPETLVSWWRRGIITTAELEQGIREGHTKTKYIPFFEAARQPLLSAATAVRLYLKGWYTKEQRDALGAQWGYSSQQMEDWFLSEGRPATVHQIHIGYARGAKLPGATNEEDAIRTAVKQSDIRPEYADLLYAQRYTLPSAFVLRGLAQSGAITPDRTHELLIQSGWPPDLAAEVTAAWTGGGVTSTKADTNVTTAHTQLRTATHRSYIIDKIDRAQADAALAHIIPSPTIRNQVLDTWDVEKTITVKPLTRAAIKKLYTNGTWTIDQAITDLEMQGMEEEDARLYLQS